MSANLVERTSQDAEAYAKIFEDMAERIRRNSDDGFGGAFVLVPPPGFGNPVTNLLLNSANLSLLFWSTLAQVANSETERLKAEQRSVR